MSNDSPLSSKVLYFVKCQDHEHMSGLYAEANSFECLKCHKLNVMRTAVIKKDVVVGAVRAFEKLIKGKISILQREQTKNHEDQEFLNRLIQEEYAYRYTLEVVGRVFGFEKEIKGVRMMNKDKILLTLNQAKEVLALDEDGMVQR